MKLLAAWAVIEPSKVHIRRTEHQMSGISLSVSVSKVLASFRERAGFSWAPGWIACGILRLSLQFHLHGPQWFIGF